MEIVPLCSANNKIMIDYIIPIDARHRSFKSDVYTLLYYAQAHHKISMMDHIRLSEMIESPDQENLIVVELILRQKLK